MVFDADETEVGLNAVPSLNIVDTQEKRRAWVGREVKGSREEELATYLTSYPKCEGC